MATTSVLIPQKRNSRTASEDRLVSAPCPKAGSGSACQGEGHNYSFGRFFLLTTPLAQGTTVQFGCPCEYLFQSSIFRRLASIMMKRHSRRYFTCREQEQIEFCSSGCTQSSRFGLCESTRTACALGRLQPALPRWLQLWSIHEIPRLNMVQCQLTRPTSPPRRGDGHALIIINASLESCHVIIRAPI